jgi:glucose uptake protein GlcU
MLVAFLRGATALGCVIAGLLFYKFWKTTTDRLFGWFALAFVILGVDFTVLGLLPRASEWQLPVYLVRLVSFAVILYAIVEKNRPSKHP